MRSPTDSFRRVELFGLDFVDADELSEVSDVILSFHDEPRVASDKLPVVITPNVDHLVQLDGGTDDAACRLAERAAIILPDGQPIVWASKLLGTPLSARLPGSGLIGLVWPRIVADGRRALVISSSEQTSEKIRSEGELVDAITAPLLDLAEPESVDQFVGVCIDAAVAQGSEFVFVTLGFPKQCNIIARMQSGWPDDLPLPLFLAVGASFDMHYGLVRRAPELFQRLGLEWFFRFLLEPRRMFHRYFVRDVAFVGLVVRERRLRASG